MRDNIQMKKIGALGETMTVEITSQSSQVHVNTTVHLTNTAIEELRDTIGEFLSEPDLEVYWESDIPGLGDGPTVSFRFLPGDSENHVLIENYLELDDGSDFSRHTCCFYIHSSRHSISEFSKQLYVFAGQSDIAVVSLNE